MARPRMVNERDDRLWERKLEGVPDKDLAVEFDLPYRKVRSICNRYRTRLERERKRSCPPTTSTPSSTPTTPET